MEAVDPGEGVVVERVAGEAGGFGAQAEGLQRNGGEQVPVGDASLRRGIDATNDVAFERDSRAQRTLSRDQSPSTLF